MRNVLMLKYFLLMFVTMPFFLGQSNRVIATMSQSGSSRDYYWFDELCLAIKSGGKAVSETVEIGFSEYVFFQGLNDYTTKIEGV